MNEDVQWLRAYVEQGAEDAFRNLVERHAGLVFSVALRCVSGERPLAEVTIASWNRKGADPKTPAFAR
ncbi:MAG TPA: hypothetical protein VIW07_10430 [Candidatus Udaeobacter sp.]|jgi:hypothetical protein